MVPRAPETVDCPCSNLTVRRLMAGAVLAELPGSWAAPLVTEVGAVRLGRQRTPAQMSGRNATPYLRAGNITEHGLDLSDVLTMDFTTAERETYALREGDLVLAEGSGSPSHVGRAAIWRDELPLCCMQNTVIRFRPHAATPEYALAVFRHYATSGLFARTARGIDLLHLGARRFGELSFPLPPRAEQIRIVAVLDSKLDELLRARVALESALNGTHQQDHAIFAAAATGQLLRTADQAGRPRLSQPDDRPGDLTDRHSIPADWAWEMVGAVGELMLGKSLGAASRRGSNVRPYLRVANVLENTIDLSDLKEMAFSDRELEKYALQDGDILLNDGQSPELVGRAAIYHAELPELYFQNHLIRFRSTLVDAQYAILVFRHYLHAGEFRRLARGSTNIANLSQARLASMPFPVPPLEEQREIAAEARRRLEASLDQREAIVSSLERAHEMAAELLRAAVTGQLVGQDPADEPADQLVRRLGSPPADPRPAKMRRVAGPDDKAGDTPMAAAARARNLSAVLADADRPLTLLELCRAADVDINDVDQIELFYITLRAELGQSIRIVGDGGESTALEVIDSAT